jgi:signal peptidase I
VTDADAEIPAEPPSDRHDASATRRAIEWLLVIVGALVVAYLIQLTSLQAFSIPSKSMLPTLHEGDRVLVNKWSYRLHDIHRGDVVVFARPPEVTDTRIDDLIKRVVGLPGEEITIDGGRVLVDGEAIDEPYLASGTRTDPGPLACAPEDPCKVPDGEIWVMGDNRTNSEDSRWFGSIPESTVVGRASVRIWPPKRLGGL